MGKLVECKSCKKEVDSSARKCPNCGVSNPGISTAQGCLGVVSLAIIIAVIMATCSEDTRTPEQKAKDKAEQAELDCKSTAMAQVMAKDFVKKALKSPATAKFPLLADSTDYLGNCTHIVKSYVDAQNAFGAVIRKQTIVKLRYDKATGVWNLEDISIN